TSPLSLSCCAIRCAKLEGIAKPKPIDPASLPVPADSEAIIEFMPTKLPLISTKGPPELPGFTAASVWMASMRVDCQPHWEARTGRLNVVKKPKDKVVMCTRHVSIATNYSVTL